MLIHDTIGISSMILSIPVPESFHRAYVITGLGNGLGQKGDFSLPEAVWSRAAVLLYITWSQWVKSVPSRLDYCVLLFETDQFGLVMKLSVWVNIGSGNGLLPNGTRGSLEPVDFPLKMFCVIQLRVISQEVLMNLINSMCSEIRHL